MKTTRRTFRSADQPRWVSQKAALAFAAIVMVGCAPPAAPGVGASSTSLKQGAASAQLNESASAQSFKDGGALEFLKSTWGGRGTASPAKEPIQLTAFPLGFDDLGTIGPMGLMVGAHVTPSDHLSIRPKWMSTNRSRGQGSMQVEDLEGGHRCPVFAPADGHISAIGLRRHPVEGDRSLDITQYRVIMRHSDLFWTYIDLIDELEPSIAAKVDFSQQGTVPCWVEVKAGQKIGTLVKNHGLDYGVVDASKTLPGFIRPESYVAEPWKIHTVDPFDYTIEPLRTKLQSYNLRKVAPLGGKIDYDKPGTLSGSWFSDKNDGMSASGSKMRVDWTGHLSFVKHYVDAKLIVISIGDVNGRQMQFAVKGNSPDPANVTEKSGLVKYQLMMLVSPSSAAPMANAPETVVGTVLVQVLPNEKLKYELFYGSDASAFDSNARTFAR